MEKKDFLNNRDRILNDLFDRYTGTEIARIMDALIVFEAISNGKPTEVFHQRAIDAQYQLIVFSIRVGSYRCEVVLS
jgi:hypothetical protein